MMKSDNVAMQKDASDLFKDILYSKNRGKVYELLVYSFFRELRIPFITHFNAPDNSCLKTSDSYISDGKFSFGFENEADDEESSVLFEVKSLGMGEPMLIKLSEQLRKQMPDYYILVEGSLDVLTKEMQVKAMERIADICKVLRENESADGDLYYSFSELNINIRAVPYDK